ncbi:serine hydrolase domain-containing protein [Ferrimonas marina]|uniref:Beta-lactamase n=1 Tax=Ferrimonas marina TaxID=299255 RepID=A0A1M5XHS5_9GAMM|nr:serine hydrolase [Ferrimonas marina]SHH99182.1 Beta-lactamase [Ferrimonas marina]
MKRQDIARMATLAVALFAAAPQAGYDYFEANRRQIQHGVQAVLMCNGLFTSQRTLEQVFAQELVYLKQPVGTVAGGDYHIDRQQQWVRVGQYPGARAVFRPGIGCVVMGPEQGVDEIGLLPQRPALPTAAPDLAWPMGDKTEAVTPYWDEAALQAASDWAFDRPTPEQDTLSLLVLHRGQIVHERYAEGVDAATRTRTWSTAKSIASTLIGMLVDEQRLSLDGPLSLDWLPQASNPQTDPRNGITLRHLLNMTSGLYPVDSHGMEYATGSGLSYWAGASSHEGARRRGLVRAPGSVWDYENYDTLLAVAAMKQELGEDYLSFPTDRLLAPLGMRSTLLSTDRFGDFVLSSQVYTNARDLARFGLLYQQNGVWQGQRLLSEAWIEFVRTPAPASAERQSDYGGHWWLVPSDRDDVPQDAYATAGNRGQFVIVVPSHELVIVRRGLDYGEQGFDRWDLTREVIKAFAQE